MLAIAGLFEGGSLLIGFRYFRSESRGPLAMADSARKQESSCVHGSVGGHGRFNRSGGRISWNWLAGHYHRPEFDGAASCGIGLLLIAVSTILARESKSLLVGEAMSAEAREEICRLVTACEGVVRSNRPLTLYFGPDFILLAIEVEFAPGLAGAALTDAVDRIERTVRQRFPKIQQIYIEAEAISSAGSPRRV